MIIDAPKTSELPALRALWTEAFGDGEGFLNVFLGSVFSASRSRRVLTDGEPSAALYWFDCSFDGERIAYIYAVATAEKYRGRGLCRALMKDTHEHLKSLGYAGAILVPGSQSLFDFYGKLGYKTSAYISELRCSASDTEAKLRNIGVSEYAKLRRDFLPEHGVLQENENLTFLEKQAKFYVGDGFLLAARTEKGTVFGLELLGNRELAPDIVRALGCENGIFRVNGDGKPFAMYLDLEGKDRAPSYFAFAFD